MIIEYKNKKVEKICTKICEAKKTLGAKEAERLFALINLIGLVKNLDEVSVFKRYRVHSLENKNHDNRKGQVSCTIPSSPLRVILIPIDAKGIKWDGSDEIDMYKLYTKIKIKEVIDYHE